MKIIEFQLAYEFVRQGIWDEWDFQAWVLDIGLAFIGRKRMSDR
jgi:hypothetical protein